MFERGAWTLLGGVVVAAIASGVVEAYKDAQREVQRRNGTRPPRWTDANRWDRD